MSDPREPAGEPDASRLSTRRAASAAHARRFARAVAIDRTPLRVSADYRRIWWGEIVSQAGTQITVVAVYFQVTALTKSATKVGLVGLVQLVPLMLATIVGGPFIDRVDRRKILLITQVGFLITSGTLLAGSLMHRTPLGLIYGAVAVSAALSGIASPTRGSIVPNLIPAELLASAVALNQVMWNAAQIIGPALAGVIIARFGLRWAYALDLLSFAAAIYAVLRLPPQIAHAAREGAASGVRAIAEAWRFVRASRVLQATFIVDIIAMTFGMPRALFPLLAQRQFHHGAEVVGLLFSAIAVGAVIGASTAGWVGRIKRQGFAVLIAVAAWGASIAAFGMTHSLWLALVFLAFAGMADVISAVFRGTILQTVVTDDVRGRLSAIHILVVTGGPRLGDFEAGVVAGAFTPTISVVSGGLACVVGVAVLAVAMPAFAAYRSPE